MLNGGILLTISYRISSANFFDDAQTHCANIQAKLEADKLLEVFLYKIRSVMKAFRE